MSIVFREIGAIEATVHKVITVPPVDGKLTPDNLQSAQDANAHSLHMAQPKLVYKRVHRIA